MERRVKERMVGAAILVAIVVLVVPELLSGPARVHPRVSRAILPTAAVPEPMRTVRVDLNGNVEASALAGRRARRRPVPCPRPRRRPRPASPATPPPSRCTGGYRHAGGRRGREGAAGDDARDRGARGEGAGRQSAGRARLPALDGKRGAWIVQLGSFESKANAEKLMKQWKSKGYPAYLSSVGAGSSMRHRVRIGPYADRAAALAAVARLKASRQAASVVSPGH